MWFASSLVECPVASQANDAARGEMDLFETEKESMMSTGGEIGTDTDEDEVVDCGFEYRGCNIRRGAGGHGWLIIRARGVTGAKIGEEDTRLELSSLDAVRRYLDGEAEEP